MSSVIANVFGNLVQLNSDRLQGIQFARSTPGPIINEIVDVINDRAYADLHGYNQNSPYALRIVPTDTQAALPNVSNQEALAFRTGGRCFIWRTGEVDLVSSMEPGLVISFITPEQFPFNSDGSNISLRDISNEVGNVLAAHTTVSHPAGDWRKISEGIFEVLQFYSMLLQDDQGCDSGVWWKCVDNYLRKVEHAFLANQVEKFEFAEIVFGAASLPMPDNGAIGYRGNWDAKSHYKLLMQYFNRASSIEDFAKYLCMIRKETYHPISDLGWDSTYETSISFSEHIAAAVIGYDSNTIDSISAWSKITVSNCKEVLKQSHALLAFDSPKVPILSFEMFKKRYVVFPIHYATKIPSEKTTTFEIADIAIKIPLEHSESITPDASVVVKPDMIVANTKAISISYAENARVENNLLVISGMITLTVKNTQYENWFRKPIALKVLKMVTHEFVTKEAVAHLLIPHPLKASIFLTLDERKYRNKPVVEFIEFNDSDDNVLSVDIEGTCSSTIVISSMQNLSSTSLEHPASKKPIQSTERGPHESIFEQEEINTDTSLLIESNVVTEFIQTIESNETHYWSPIIAAVRKGNIDISSPPNSWMLRDIRGKIEGILSDLIENIEDHSIDTIGMLNMIAAVGDDYTLANSANFQDHIMWLSEKFTAANFHLNELKPKLSEELLNSSSYSRFTKALMQLLLAVKANSLVFPKWISRTPLLDLPMNVIEEYLQSYSLLLQDSLKFSDSDQYWIKYSGAITIYDGNSNDVAGILLTPINPIRLGWIYCAETSGRECEDNEQNLFQLIESWNYPWVISSPALTGSDALLAIPLDPGDKQIFLGWSALLKFNNRGGSPIIPSTISGFKFPGVSSSGLNEGGVRAAISDFLHVHPYLSSLHIDLFRRDVGTRSTELDKAICKEIANCLNSASSRRLQSVNVSDSINRKGSIPSYDEIMEYIDYEDREGISFGWKQYKATDFPHVDIRLVEDASTKIAIQESNDDFHGVIGNIPLKRFPTRLKSNSGGNHKTYIYFNLTSCENAESWQDFWINSLYQIELINQKSVGILFNADLQNLGLGGNAKWTITGNIHSDPELLASTLNSAGHNQLLWEWRPAFLDNTGNNDGLRLDSRSYNTVAQIPEIFRERLKGSTYNDTQIDSMIGELGRRGIGLSSLLAMGYNHVTGAFGFFYSFRILNVIQQKLPENVYGIVIPIDAANKFITSLAHESSAKIDKRADLLLIILDCRDDVKIEFVPIEVTHRNIGNPQAFPPPLGSAVREKLEQLESTSKRIEELVSIANTATENSMIRLAIANLIETGFIIALGSSGKVFDPKSQELIMKQVITGNVEYTHLRNFMLFFQPRVQDETASKDVAEYYLPLSGSSSNGLIFIDNEALHDELWNEGVHNGMNSISENLIDWIINDSKHVSITETKPTSENSSEEKLGKTKKMIDISLGKDSDSNDVRWQPNHPMRGLNNAHMVIVGSSGSGKTTTINSIVKSLKNEGIPSIIFDFKDDYIGDEFKEISGATVYNTIYGIPINPLDIPIDPETGLANVNGIVYEVSGAIRKVFQLGVQQEANLKEALFTLYERYGIKKGFQKLHEDQIYPTFNELYEVIDEIGDGKLLNRISSLFDLDMFQPNAKNLNTLTDKSVVIRFTQLPTDEVKKVGSELLLMGIYNFILRLGHSKEPRFCIIIDEAHKIANLKAIDTLMREARAYGVSIILSTQRASDFSAHVYSNAGSTLIMKLSESGDAMVAARIIGDQGSAKVLGDSIRSLGIGEAYLRNDHYNSPNVKLKIALP
jgi:hypothetical protein